MSRRQAGQTGARTAVAVPPGPLEWSGFLGSWLLLGAGAGWLYTGMQSLAAIGGHCASGGAYQIAVDCSDDAGLGIVFGMLAVTAGVGLGLTAGRGFGVPSFFYFWTLLFGTAGLGFLHAAFGSTAGVSANWLFCGLLFLIVAAPPLFLLHLGWPRSVLGRRRLDGRSLADDGVQVLDAAVIGGGWLVAAACGVAIAVSLNP